MLRNTIVALLATSLFLACGGSDAPKPKEPIATPVTTPKIENISLEGASPELGRIVYNASCAYCHGPEGKGDGVMAKDFAQRAADFSSAATWEKLSDNELVHWIQKGSLGMGKDSGMPSFEEALTPEQIRDVAAYVKSLVVAQ